MRLGLHYYIVKLKCFVLSQLSGSLTKCMMLLLLLIDVSSVIDVSYQSIELELLRDYLGDTSGTAFTEIAQTRGWQVSNAGDSSQQIVHIRKQESTIKPKKILAKIEFDSKTIITITLCYVANQDVFMMTCHVYKLCSQVD